MLYKYYMGKILCSYFAQLEAKAWENTEQKPLFDTLSWGMGQSWYVIAESNSRYYAFLKTNYGKPSPYAGYYMNSYMLRQLLLSKLFRFFGKKHEIRSYDPFKLIKSISAYFLHQYFISLKERAKNSSDYYRTLSWGHDEEWFNILQEEARLDADIKTQYKQFPRYYRYYAERYIFLALMEDAI